jgi:hypothetical protein
MVLIVEPDAGFVKVTAAVYSSDKVHPYWVSSSKLWDDEVTTPSQYNELKYTARITWQYGTEITLAAYLRNEKLGSGQLV